MKEGKDLIRELKKMPEEYKGDTTVYIFTSNDNKKYRGPRDIWINQDSEALDYLKEIFEEENIRIID